MDELLRAGDIEALASFCEQEELMVRRRLKSLSMRITTGRYQSISSQPYNSNYAIKSYTFISYLWYKGFWRHCVNDCVCALCSAGYWGRAQCTGVLHTIGSLLATEWAVCMWECLVCWSRINYCWQLASCCVCWPLYPVIYATQKSMCFCSKYT